MSNDTSGYGDGDIQRQADGAAPANGDAHDATRAIPSRQLLGGRSCVTIDHQGVSYVLRATRAGKLILTK